MRLALGLRRRGAGRPPVQDAAWEYYYSAASPSFYKLSGGAVSFVYNLGSAGAAGDISIPTAANRPAILSGTFDFDGVANYMPMPAAVAAIIATKAFDVEAQINAGAAANMTWLSAVPASGLGSYQLTWQNAATQKNRNYFKNTADANVVQNSFGIGTAGTEYKIRWRHASGLVDSWRDDVQDLSGAAADLSAWDTVVTKGAFGARIDSADAVVNAFDGTVNNLKLRAV